MTIILWLLSTPITFSNIKLNIKQIDRDFPANELRIYLVEEEDVGYSGESTHRVPLFFQTADSGNALFKLLLSS